MSLHTARSSTSSPDSPFFIPLSSVVGGRTLERVSIPPGQPLPPPTVPSLSHFLEWWMDVHWSVSPYRPVIHFLPRQSLLYHTFLCGGCTYIGVCLHTARSSTSSPTVPSLSHFLVWWMDVHWSVSPHRPVIHFLPDSPFFITLSCVVDVRTLECVSTPPGHPLPPRQSLLYHTFLCGGCTYIGVCLHTARSSTSSPTVPYLSHFLVWWMDVHWSVSPYRPVIHFLPRQSLLYPTFLCGGWTYIGVCLHTTRSSTSSPDSPFFVPLS